MYTYFKIPYIFLYVHTYKYILFKHFIANVLLNCSLSLRMSPSIIPLTLFSAEMHFRLMYGLNFYYSLQNDSKATYKASNKMYCNFKVKFVALKICTIFGIYMGKY